MTEVLTELGRWVAFGIFLIVMLCCVIAPLLREAERDEWQGTQDE